MAVQVRFGKKLRLESTFQIKHRLMLWWLKSQTEKEAVEADATVAPRPPMYVHKPDA